MEKHSLVSLSLPRISSRKKNHLSLNATAILVSRKLGFTLINLIQEAESEPVFDMSEEKVGPGPVPEGGTLLQDADTVELWESSMVLFLILFCAGFPPFFSALFWISWSPCTLGFHGLYWP